MSQSDHPECRHEHGASRSSAVAVELREHVPFSVSAVAIGLIVAGTICIVGSGSWVEHGTGLDLEHDHAHAPADLFFHLFHPAHMLFSGAATTAMFCRYEHRPLKAVVIGLIGAVGVCGISDILMPHVSLWILRVPVEWHICVWEHPGLVIPFAGVGVLVGVAAAGGVMKSTIISHSLHVFASTMASIFYMVGPIGTVAWIDRLGQVFLFIVLAVMVPCCLSDIVFPTFMSKPARDQYDLEPHCH